MSSIVLELQKDSLDVKVPLTDLLRKTMVVAKKLKVTELESWTKKELNGYDDGDCVPTYRYLHGTPKVLHPRGWQPIMFQDEEEARTLSTRFTLQAIAEIEHMVKKARSGGKGTFEIAYPGSLAQNIMESIGHELRPSLHISSSKLEKILDSVRNVILQWTLKLEEDGILGNGLTFSAKEKEAAIGVQHSLIIHGNVSNSQFQQGTSESTQTHNSQLGVSPILENIQKALATNSILSEEQVEIARSYINVIESQAMLTQKQRNIPLVQQTWEKLGRICDLISLGEFIYKATPHLQSFFGFI